MRKFHLFNVSVIYWGNLEQRAQVSQDGFIADSSLLRFETAYTGHVESTAYRRFVRAQAQVWSDQLIYDVALFKDAKLVARAQFQP